MQKIESKLSVATYLNLLVWNTNHNNNNKILILHFRIPMFNDEGVGVGKDITTQLRGVLRNCVQEGCAWTGKEFIGDFHNYLYIDIGWEDDEEEKKLKKRSIKVNNGCAPVLGIAGPMTHEKTIQIGHNC